MTSLRMILNSSKIFNGNHRTIDTVARWVIPSASNHTIKTEGNNKGIKKHRLLVCKCCKPCKFELRIKATSVIKNDGSENKNIVFINRDVNACLNILDLSNEYIFKKLS